MSTDEIFGMESHGEPQNEDGHVEHGGSDADEAADSDKPRQGERVRVLTERGLTYQLEILRKKCKKSLTQV